jgi:AcrR family transcriptional regulator
MAEQGKRETKREDLRTRILTAATKHIEKSGILGLRARDIAEDAGCALGGLYTVFADLDALIIAVNSQTLQRLDETVEAATNDQTPPGEQLLLLGRHYLAFARNNPRLWRALFEHRLAEGREFPDWHLANQVKLLTHIAKPVGKLQPQLDSQAQMIHARTLFAAVHGIVSISLDNRFIGLPTATLDAELERFISLLLRGLEAGSSLDHPSYGSHTPPQHD